MVKDLGCSCFYPFTGRVCFIHELLLAGGKQGYVHSAGHPGASINTEIAQKNIARKIFTTVKSGKYLSHPRA